MKKLFNIIIALTALLAINQVEAMNTNGKTQQPPAEMQPLFKNYAQAVDALTNKAKEVPELKADLDNLTAIRSKLADQMKQNQNSKLQEPPKAVQGLMNENQKALKAVVDNAKKYPATQALAEKVESLGKQAEAKMKQLQTVPAAQKQTAKSVGSTSTATVRKARKIQ